MLLKNNLLKNRSKYIANFLKKNYFGLFSKIKIKKNSELIIHPEYVDKLPQNNPDLSDIESEISQDNNIDEDISFISLDKNNIPIIKANYYESLGVKQTSNPKEIKINFLKIARKFHPDKNPDTLVKYFIINSLNYQHRNFLHIFVMHMRH
jgi:hypothetical protein